MSFGEVLYLSGASNHCQEHLQRWSLRLPRVTLYIWRGGHSYDFTCYPCRQNVRWKRNQKVGSLLNRLIQISWFYASITFLQCNIYRNYGFIRVLSQTPRMGVFIPVHSICCILNPVLCNILPTAHAITGCDSTSSLFGIDKQTVFKVLKDSPENFKDLFIPFSHLVILFYFVNNGVSNPGF